MSRAKCLKILRDGGVEVVSGVLEGEGKDLNRVFFHHMETGLPWIHLKIAQTLDGKIMSSSGDSKWITNEESRELVHRMRFEYDGVMVGKKTAIADNPLLNIRHIDSHGKDPFKIITGSRNGCESLELYENKKSIFVSTKDRSSVDLFEDNLEALLKSLNKKKITSILVEGAASSFRNLLMQTSGIR